MTINKAISSSWSILAANVGILAWNKAFIGSRPSINPWREQLAHKKLISLKLSPLQAPYKLIEASLKLI